MPRATDQPRRPPYRGRSRASIGLAAFVLVMTVGCRSAPPTRPDRDLGHRIDALVEVERGPSGGGPAPGMAVMVIRDGVVVHARGYGAANLEPARPITRATPFRLASVTKQFTCLAILELAEQGKLSIDDAAVDYVPSLARFGRGVTIRHLMQHTSGLPEYYDELARLEYQIPSADDDPLLTAIDASQLYEHWGEQVFEPGERYDYSNPGYEQLALIIEKVSGQTYGDYLREAVLTPAGMPTAMVRDRPDRAIPDRAIGYRPARKKDAGADAAFTQSLEPGYREFDDHPANWIVGAGCLYASLDDLYYWDRALTENRLVSESTKAQAFAPATLNDGSHTEYGFGWTVDQRHGRRRVSHGGAWVGFRTTIERYPDDGVTIVVLANWDRARPGRVAQQIAALVFADERAASTRLE